MPSGVITTSPIEAWSKASRTRSKSMRGESRAIALIDAPLFHARRARRGIERRAAERGAEARAQPLRQLLEDVLPGREIDHLLGLDDVASHVVEAAQAVGEPQLDALLAGPDAAGEHVGRLLQPRAAALAHHLDELLVDLAQHLLRVLHVRRVLGREGIEEILVLAGVVGAPLDAELLQRLDEAEAGD